MEEKREVFVFEGIKTDDIRQFAGEMVSVYISLKGFDRADEVTQVSIRGILEGSKDDRFRVMHNEFNYSYFKTKDVMSIMDTAEEGVKVNIALIMNNEPRNSDLSKEMKVTAVIQH